MAIDKGLTAQKQEKSFESDPWMDMPGFEQEEAFVTQSNLEEISRNVILILEMSCSITERVSSTSASVPSASNIGGAIGGAATVGTSTSSSQASRCRERLGFEGNSLSNLTTSPNSRSTGQGAGTLGGAGPPQNGPQSSSPQGSQLRSKPCSTMLLCCCCKCPWSNPGNKNDENGTTKNSSSDLETCVSPSPMEEVRVTMDELRSWGKSFDKLMKSNAGRKVFRNFLKGEYSEENILFWLACEDFKKHTDKANVEKRARLIYMHYIHPASSTEVSLDARVREIVKKHLPDPQSNMYDEAQLQIYTLMQRDSYPRFINSQMFKALAQQTEKKGRDKVSFWIQPQKTPSLHTIELSTSELLGGDHGQASQTTPLLTAARPSATTPASDFSDRDQDAS